jgi:surface antigen
MRASSLAQSGRSKWPVRSSAIIVLLALVASLSTVLVGAQPASATLGTNDYPSDLKNAAQDSVVDPWGFYNRECVSFVAWRLNNDNGLAFSNNMGGGHFGNAVGWKDNAIALGYTYTANTGAVRGSVAWWDAGYHGADATFGHVSYVYATNSDGSIDTEDYNAAGNGMYATHHYAVGSGSWPSGFIHLKDLGQVAAQEDIHAISKQDLGSNHTVRHVINGSNWGQYLQQTATGLPMTNADWSYQLGDFNADGVLDLWGINRNPSQVGGNHTVVHVLNGSNLGSWLQSGNIVLPSTNGEWDFGVGYFNADNTPDIYAFNTNPNQVGGNHTVVFVINGANWGQYLQVGNIVLPSTNSNWEFEVGKYNADGVSDIYAINHNPGGANTEVRVINGANWGAYLQQGYIVLPSTNSEWSYELGKYDGDSMPDIYAINRNPNQVGGNHTVVFVINGANWGLYLQVGNIVLPSTDSNWDFAVGNF